VSLSEQLFLLQTRNLKLEETLRDLGSGRGFAASFARGCKEKKNMLGLIAAILIICWLIGLFAFHVSTGLFHILIVVGIILLILHFVSGKRVSA
jgi:Flp pilus assembly protein TadB